MIGVVVSAVDGTAFDPFTLLSDGSTLGVAAVVVAAAFKAHNYLRKSEREDRTDTEERIERLQQRLDRVRTNNLRLMEYAGRVARQVPPDVELPPYPELLPEYPPIRHEQTN